MFSIFFQKILYLLALIKSLFHLLRVASDIHCVDEKTPGGKADLTNGREKNKF